MPSATTIRRRTALVLAIAMAAALLAPAGIAGAASQIELCEGPNLSLPKCNPPIEMLGAPDTGLMYWCVKGDCRIDLFGSGPSAAGTGAANYTPDAFCTIFDYTCGPLAGLMRAPKEPEMGIMMCQAARRSEEEVSVWCE